MKVLPIVLVLTAGALAIAAPTAGQDPVAQADALAKVGDYVGAAGKFKLAYADDPRPELICNVGVAYYKAKQLARAQLFLTRCLERGTALDAKFVATVRKALESVESALRTGAFTPVDIVVEPAGATVTIQAFGEDESFVGSRVVWLPRGKQTLIARAEGYVEQSLEIDAQGRERQPVKLALQRVPAPTGEGSGSATGSAGSNETGTGTGSASVAPTGSGSAAVVTPEPARVPMRYERPSKVPALVATSVAVGGLALAIVAYQRAHDRADYAAFALSQDAYKADKSTVTTWNTVMLTGTAVAVVSAGVAGYLWSRAFRSAPVEMQATGSSIAISGRW